MASTATNEGQGAKRVGRLVSRALLVFGGAVAGTAAAWLVSGATASADTVEVGTASVTPVAEAADGSIADADHGAKHFSGDIAGGACHQDATTWSEPRTECGRTLRHEVSERVGDSVSDLAGDAVLSPAERTLGAVEHIASKPEDTRQVIEETVAPAPAKEFGRQVWQLLDPAAHGDLLPSLPGLAPAGQGPAAAGTGQQAGTAAVTATELPAAWRADALATSTGLQHDDVTGAAGHSRDGHRNLPSPLTPAQLPIAPAVPTAPGGSTTSGGTGGHSDGFNVCAPSRAAEAIDTAFAAMSRVGLRRSLRSPGKQPGVTPD
ncbi:hypothetical protein [Amycolatopsis vastitatis]|uniref:Uncharacterized protein n=1 Tax=Amycolatopsis vastitatis TaxID=1905142 RepID=A0A229TJE5_9PSEU|nr:hypothetical protein [Amycolatopsis vastitatis]OXM70839.1 hypothetical protein CF165_02850 [Amycolatopsis vastitatis]